MSDFGSATLTKSNSGGTCGIVADVRFDSSNRGPAMFVDLDRTHPIESMQIVIPQRDLSQFDPSPASWEGKRICVTGSVQNYRGRPEIVAYGPRPDPALPALRPLLCHEKETHLFFPGNLVVKQST